MMRMDFMAMTFFTASDTPLYSMSWMPASVGQYAGTCKLLIVLAAIVRSLLALRFHFYTLLAAADARRNGGLVHEPDKNRKSVQHPWRAREGALLGFLGVVLAGLGIYLLYVQPRNKVICRLLTLT